jgi:type VI secretion system protein ImpG
MSLRERFREELSFLRLQGREFARHNPQLSRFLGEQASDPDVERLLEGFAFLTARLRLKLEDDFEELTHSLLQLLWPNYLRPLPSLAIVRFDPIDRGITERKALPSGLELRSRPIEGHVCRFRTCHEIDVYPLVIDGVSDEHTREHSVLRIDLRSISNHRLGEMGCDRLDVHLSGSDFVAQTLYLWLARYVAEVRLVAGDEVRRLDPASIEFPGFAPEEALLPYPKNVFDGYRILQEFFLFPQRYHFVRLTGLDRAWPDRNAEDVRVEFVFNRPMPSNVRITDADLALYCVPAVNLFSHDAEPVRLGGQAEDYPLIPSGGREGPFEIFSVDRVFGAHGPGRNAQGEYASFESFGHEVEYARHRRSLYYRLRAEDHPADSRLRYRIGFVRGDEARYLGRQETISAELTCSDGDLPTLLAPGELCVPTQGVASFVTFTNLRAPTAPCRPVLDGSLHWTLLSNLSLNYLSLLDAAPLRAVLRAYDFAALHDLQRERSTRRRLDAIGDVRTVPVDRLIRGLPVRGLRTMIALDAEGFLGEGELYLFGAVLSRFFALYASINSFHQLEVINTSNQEAYTWPLFPGRQPVI